MLRHFLLAGAASLALVKAQTDKATCLVDTAHQWGYNTLGQSPCDVAGDLLSTCLNRDVYIVALDPGRIYSGAIASGDGNDCRCSSVYYAVLASCSQCQGRNWGTWADQIELCNGTVFRQTLPVTIPAGTRVPQWAYLDYPSIGTFDLATARDAALGSTSPSPTPTPTPRQSFSSFNPFPSQTFTAAGPHSNGNGGGDDIFPDTEKKKTNIGAIVGGVVGGLAALGIIGGLIAFILLRNRKNKQQQANAAAYGEKPVPGVTSPYFPQPQAPMGTGGTPIYNPNDPSTYPTPVTQPQYTGTNPSPFGSPQLQPQAGVTAYNQSPFATPPVNQSFIHSDGSSPHPQQAQLTGGTVPTGYAPVPTGPARAAGYAGAPEL